jgi:hypothetical protein
MTGEGGRYPSASVHEVVAESPNEVHHMKKLLIVAVLLGGLYYGYQEQQVIDVGGTVDDLFSHLATSNDTGWRSGSQVKGSGTVVRVLSDDNDGSRHQRFILKLSSGRTVLIAHNIDLAPRVRSISSGDTVSFFGQFESNEQGGVIHWTHDDPRGRHVGGWLEHDGNRYH